MRPVKLFGLAAIAAMAAMALIGAAPATAGNTALCSTNNGGLLTCPIEKQVTSFHSVALNTIFLTTVGNVTCKEALAEGTVLGLAAPQVSHLTKFNWTGCTGGGGIACTVTTTKLGLILFLKTAVNLGELVYDNLVFRIVCAPFIDCEYTPIGAAHLLGSTLPLLGGESNGGFGGTKLTLAPAGPLDAPCPEASWDYFYESLTPLWVKT
jgi:hypothetical protein